MMDRLTDEQLQDLYTWVDKIPLSRPKRNISRDFSDGVLYAEIINHYHPKLIELHNYSAANSLKQKVYNWETLNTKVLRRLKCTLTENEIQDVCNCKPNTIERLLLKLRGKLATFQEYTGGRGPRSVGGSSRASSRERTNYKDQYQQNTPSKFSAHEDEFRPDYISTTSSNRGFSGNNNNISGSNNNRDIQMLLEEKDQTILELRDTISIMELKIKKLEQLIQLKDNKIAALQQQI